MFKKNALISLLLILICAAISVHAQSLTSADRDKAMTYLESSKQVVIDATKGLTPAQWNFEPAPDRWSVDECTEHVAAAEDLLRGMVVEKVMKAGPRPAGDDVAAIDHIVLAAVPDRSVKRQAPDPLRPTNRFGSPEGSLKAFLESRNATEDLRKNTNGLREDAIMSPLGKNMDGYEWVLFIAAHSERHTKQILEVKADPNFPKM
ncbi:MAG TPA: DinB family protein [Candidatus Sulfotelmatobacter sp.]|nr:DinB family protein [Candidatus Sulfotelmatobacter sp.]